MNSNIPLTPSLTVGILCSNRFLEEALSRYLSYVLKYRSVSLSAFLDMYRRKEAFDLVQSVDLVFVEALQNDQPVGFQFAKSIGKPGLIFFYHWDHLDIETEGPSWLVLPEGIEQVSLKLLETVNQSIVLKRDLESLEQRFPVLKDPTAHSGI